MDKNIDIKNISQRFFFGFPTGIAIGYSIAIAISLIYGNGSFSPCSPALIQSMGNEINAVLFQAFLTGILGSLFSVASIIWDMDDLSLLKQTLYFFSITSISLLIIAYLLKWFSPTIFNFLSFLMSFILIFAIIWIIQYLIWKAKINKINSKFK